MFGYRFILGVAFGYWLKGTKLAPAIEDTISETKQSVQKIYTRLKSEFNSRD
jgi:hypothetical protein